MLIQAKISKPWIMAKGENISMLALVNRPRSNHHFCLSEIIFVKSRKCPYTKIVKEIAKKCGTAVSIKPSKLLAIINNSSFPVK